MSTLTIYIDEIVMHGIPGRGSDTDELALSDVPSPLDAGQKAYIQERIRSALNRYARPIVSEHGNQLPESVSKILEDSSNLLEESKILAAHLLDSQPTISPPGIVVVATGRNGSKPAVILAKLEHEIGVRAHQMQLATGETTFDVELIKDLLFTEQSRVFKVAVLSAREIDDRLEGFMVYHQAASHGVAQFFLSSFLGCALSEKSDVLTERFHKASEKWINQLEEASKKGKYEIALISELQSHSSKISVPDFAHRYLDLADRDGFETSLSSAGVPDRTFTKDTTLIENKLKQVRLDTVSGVIVLAPPSSIEDGTVTMESDDESTVIVVRDDLKKVSGRGRSSTLAPESALPVGEENA